MVGLSDVPWESHDPCILLSFVTDKVLGIALTVDPSSGGPHAGLNTSGNKDISGVDFPFRPTIFCFKHSSDWELAPIHLLVSG